MLTTAQRTALVNKLPSWSGIQWRAVAYRGPWAQKFLVELDGFRAIASLTTTLHYQQRHKQIIKAVGLPTEPYDAHVRGQ